MQLRALAPLFVALALLAPRAQAQTTLEVYLTAKIEKLATPPSCAPKATHKAACSDVNLVAGAGVDLSKVEGQTVDLVAKPVVATCVVLEVTKVSSATYWHRITAQTGNFKLGDTVRFESRLPLISVSPWIISAGKFFFPAGTYGTLLLDPLTLVYVNNYVPLFGVLRLDVKIPVDTNLIGVTIYSQGAWVGLDSQSNPTGQLLNVDCFQIKSNQ
ncbi:MAG: hypothetical protein R3F30_13900 [Planctomycetota bacterium]